MKKYVFMFVAAVLAGTFIWSCSQDEMEDQTIYRYNAEQLAEIRALAEMYGVSAVQYPTESETGLPTIEELEKTFQVFSAIKKTISQPLEVIYKGENQILYRTKRSIAKRSPIGDGESYTGSADLSQHIYPGGFRCWLNLKVSWEGTYATDWETDTKVTINASLEMQAPELDSYIIEIEKTDFHWADAYIIVVSYSCTLRSDDKNKVPITYTFSEEVNVTAH